MEILKPFFFFFLKNCFAFDFVLMDLALLRFVLGSFIRNVCFEGVGEGNTVRMQLLRDWESWKKCQNTESDLEERDEGTPGRSWWQYLTSLSGYTLLSLSFVQNQCGVEHKAWALKSENIKFLSVFWPLLVVCPSGHDLLSVVFFF